jgi:hypothetical protein
VKSTVEELLRDPGTRRCWREVVSREDPLTLEGIEACFGPAVPDEAEMAYAEDEHEERLYRWLTETMK